MRCLLIALLQLIVLQFTYSQKNTADSTDYKWAIRTNPLGLIDLFDHHLSLGAERRFNERWSALVDLGYIFYSHVYNENGRASGYSIRPAIRLYPSRNFFVELDGFYKQVGYKKEDWLGKECVNGVPTYDTYTQFTFQKKVTGANIRVGRQVSLSRNERLRLEFHLGLGFRHKWGGIKGDPRACYGEAIIFPSDGIFFPVESPNSPVTLPSVPAGVRLIYTMPWKM